MREFGMLVNFQMCTGCMSCMVACQMENDFPVGQSGIVVNQVGPWEISKDNWQYDYIPALTKQCNTCAERRQKGKLPVCEQHCQSFCIKTGPVEELAGIIDVSKDQVLITRRGA